MKTGIYFQNEAKIIHISARATSIQPGHSFLSLRSFLFLMMSRSIARIAVHDDIAVIHIDDTRENRITVEFCQSIEAALTEIEKCGPIPVPPLAYGSCENRDLIQNYF